MPKSAVVEKQHPQSVPAPPNPSAKRISVVIPALNEATNIEKTLSALATMPAVGEVVVVDGGSRDATPEIARRSGVRVIATQPGRGRQLREGARVASHRILWFLHADTVPQPECAASIVEAMGKPGVVGGNCAIRFDGSRRCARFLTWLYPQLRALGLLYGDSGIFADRATYAAIGGFAPVPIFEDLDFVRRLRKRGQLVRLPATVTTSSRRFENGSFTITFAFWCWLQLLYWSGVSPHRLGKMYYRGKKTLSRPSANAMSPPATETSQ